MRSTSLVAIGLLHEEHWPAIAKIYAEGIATANATFETEVPEWTAWDRAHLPEHRLVATKGESVIGWAAVTSVSDRCVYGGVVEDSVYVSSIARGQGIGTALLGQLISSTEAAGIWTIQAGMFPENDASIRLHEQAGFELVGRRRKLGKLHGEWRDVLLMERRSELIV